MDRGEFYSEHLKQTCLVMKTTRLMIGKIIRLTITTWMPNKNIFEVDCLYRWYYFLGGKELKLKFLFSVF